MGVGALDGGLGRHAPVNDIGNTEQSVDRVRRRERGIQAYARIFDVPEKDVPAAMAGRVGPVFVAPTTKRSRP